MADVAHVDADLVGASGGELGLDECRLAKALQHPVIGFSRTPPLLHRHALAVGMAATDGGVDFPGVLANVTLHQGQINALHLPPGNLLR